MLGRHNGWDWRDQGILVHKFSNFAECESHYDDNSRTFYNKREECLIRFRAEYQLNGKKMLFVSTPDWGLDVLSFSQLDQHHVVYRRRRALIHPFMWRLFYYTREEVGKNLNCTYTILKKKIAGTRERPEQVRKMHRNQQQRTHQVDELIEHKGRTDGKFWSSSVQGFKEREFVLASRKLHCKLDIYDLRIFLELPRIWDNGIKGLTMSPKKSTVSPQSLSSHEVCTAKSLFL